MNEMTKNKVRAYHEIRHAVNNVIGSWENDVLDDNCERMPSHDDLVHMVYDTVMTCTSGVGIQSLMPLKEIRFAGSEWIWEQIEQQVYESGY